MGSWMMPIGGGEPLLPGETFKAERVKFPAAKVPTILVPKRLVINAKPLPPEWRFFRSRVGGSKRKGRIASNLFFAHLLGHSDKDVPQLFITDVTVDTNKQMVGGPIPAWFFNPNHYDMQLTIEAGRNISITLVNMEQYRRVEVRGAIIFQEAGQPLLKSRYFLEE